MRAPLKRIHKAACSVLIVLSFLAASVTQADWSNFGTVSMTDAVTPKLTNGYLCYSDGRDIACNTSVGPVYIGTNGLIDNGGMTVAGSVSASAVSSTYVSATVLQINPSTMPCSTGLNGTIRYSSVSSTLEVCVGTSWTTLSSNTAPGNLSGTGSATAVAFWSGTNSLSYDSGLYWDNTPKRLGVGTTVPAVPLDVSGTMRSRTNADSQLMLDTLATGQQAAVGFYSSGTTKWQIGKGTSDQFFLWDPVGMRNAMNVNSNGNMGLMPTGGYVGIGTSSPNAPLEVSGSILNLSQTGGEYMPYVLWTKDGNWQAYMGYGKAGERFIIYMNNNNRLDIIASTTAIMGSLGIGTTAPGSSLTVIGEAQVGNSGAACLTATNGGAIRYSGGSLYYCNGTNTWTTIGTGGGTVTGTGSATAVAFWSGASSLSYDSGLYWNNSSKFLGIGTTMPNEKLDVAGTVSSTGLRIQKTAGSLNFYASDGSGGAGFSLSGTSTYLHLLGTGLIALNDNVGELGNQRFRFGSLQIGTGSSRFSGRVGIGIASSTNPSAHLQVSGSLLVSTTDQAFNAPSLYVGTNGSTGIGTLTPASSLTVVGEVQVSSSGVACSTATNGGAIRYSAGVLYYCNGANTWATIGTGGGTLTGGGSATAIAFWNGANSLTYESSNTSGLYWDSSNSRIGIGTNRPVAAVDISNTRGHFWLRKGAAGALPAEAGSGLKLEASTAGSVIQAYDYGAATPLPLWLNSSGGNVGIGLPTSLPTTTLQVAGSVLVSSTVTSGSPSLYIPTTGGVSIGSTTNAWNNAGSGLYIARYSGRFGLVIAAPTDSPQSDLVLVRASNAADQRGFQLVNVTNAFEMRTLTDAGAIGKSFFYADLTSGAVGISNSNPIAKLDVVGTISASDAIQVGQSSLTCINGISGSIRFNTTSNTLQVCTNAGWVSLASGTTGGAGTLTGGGSATAVAFWNGPSSLSYDGGLYWDNSGKRLGIGTTTPSTTLHLYGVGASGNVALRMTGSGPMGSGEIWGENALYQQYVGGPLLGRTYWLGRTNGRPDFVIETRGVSNALVVNGGSGTVGIGTFSPTATLQVSGTFTVSNSTNPTAPSLFVDAAGKVGIGTAAPARALHIKGEEAGILLEETGGPSDNEAYLVNYNNIFNIQRRRADGTFLKVPYSFDMRAPEYTLTATSSGSIGIGTTMPGSSLTIIGEAQVGNSGAACVTATNGGAIRYSGGTLYYCNGSNTWMTIGAGGGTLTGGGSATAIAFWNGPSSLTYESATTSGLYWNRPNSRLGIGTSSPSYALEISTTGVSGIVVSNTTTGVLNSADINLSRGDKAYGFAGLTWATAGTQNWVLNIPAGSNDLRLWNGASTTDLMRFSPSGTVLVSGTFTVSNSTQAATAPSLFVSSGGNIGVGTSGPSATVQIDATPNTRAFYVNGSGLGQSGGLGIFGGGPQLTGIGWRNNLIGNNLYLPAATNIPTVDGANASYTKAYAISFASEDSTDTGMSFWTGAGAGTPMTAKMRLTNVGNVGIGVTSPTATLQVSGTFVVSQTGQNSLASASLAVDGRGISVSSIIHINGSALTPIGSGGNAILSGTTAVSTSSAGSITLYTGGEQKVAVNSYGLSVSGSLSASGNVLFGPSGFGWGNNGIAIQGSATGGLSVGLNSGAYWQINRKDVNGTVIGFGRNGTSVGTIEVTTLGTSYNTTSDRRTKENIVETREGLQQLMQIGVKDFSFRADPSHTVVNGFIAQDLKKVYPEAVTTNGDNGETELVSGTAPWSVDYGRVTPLIVKGVQDLKREGDVRYTELKADNDNLRALLTNQQKRIDDLTVELKTMKAAR